MKIVTGILYGLAALAELSGIALVVIELRNNQAALRRWVEANPKQNEEGAWGQQLVLNRVITDLLGSPLRRGAGVGLLVLGVILGTIGNFLSL